MSGHGRELLPLPLPRPLALLPLCRPEELVPVFLSAVDKAVSHTQLPATFGSVQMAVACRGGWGVGR